VTVVHDNARRLVRPPPGYSAEKTVSGRQRVIFIALLVIAVVLLLLRPLPTLVASVALATAFYLLILVYRLKVFHTALHNPQVITVSDDAARSVPDWLLPTYTVLVPAYGEPQVVRDLVASLEKLEYGHDQLEVKLLLEEDDEPTLRAASEACHGDLIQIIRVPPSQPRTKPKALNYGLELARGDFLTIYDAEDRPDPLQLRRAVVAFDDVDPSVVCLQAKLGYHNRSQNIITRWFTAEYVMWFSHFLPGLVSQHAPLPLGGTSNHFRTNILRQAGGWDPYNVTEDADLGVRLHRLGYRTAVLDSITFEEANSDFVNWVRQRSRWYKGYMQTWLVHMRQPIRLWKDVGTRGFLGFNLFVGGTPLLALINPVFWALTFAWFALQLSVVPKLFPGWIYYPSLLTWALGNFLIVYTNMVSVRESGDPRLLLAAILSPIYWVMMSLAAVKAVVQLVSAPSFWEKTIHGLDHSTATNTTVV
jgi:cellulose synthase/poly-beta-1,6-N-acetylglucosamine synthase-like glycosyltransferase